MSHADAVVFDLDGTLIDTEPLWDEVRRDLAAQDGVDWPPEATRAMMGMSTPEWSGYLADVVGLRGDADDCARRTIEGLAARYRKDLPLRPGAVEAVERMAARGPVGLATSSPRLLIDAIVSALHLEDAFAVTVSSEEVERGKPAPDVYLEACRRLGAVPARSVAVEDSHAGIGSAAAAGMAVVAFPHEFETPNEATLAQAAAVIASLDELTPQLVDRIAGA